jgi:hypothetical protein
VGDILDINHTMTRGSDGVFVAAPGWHNFMAEALKGVPGDRWFPPASDVVRAPGNSWYLKDATGAPKLPNDSQPTPSPSPFSYAIPSDPGTGPVVVVPTPSPCPSPGHANC